MAERKNFSGDRPAAFDYLGAARQSLMILKNDMSFNKLLTGSRTLDLPEGVRVYVACVFGQDTIDINVPPGTAVEALVRRQVAAESRTIDAVPIEPEYESAFIKFDFTDNAFCNDRGILIMTKTFPAPARRIYIGGYRDDGNSRPITDPLHRGPRPVYFSPAGLKYLGMNSGTFGDQAGGIVLGLTPDGGRPVGFVEVWDVAGVFVPNPFPGKWVGGYIERPALWRDPLTRDANIAGWISNVNSGAQSNGRGKTVDASGTVRGEVQFGGGFRWNGNSGVVPTTGQSVPADSPMVSADGRVRVNTNTYQVDGGAPVAWGDSRCYARCVVSFQDPTPQPIVTSITF